jgi:signal transduction histidine kinase/ligand-binding sensor domain-containing protein
VNPNLSLDQFLHTSWTQEEGTPLPPVNALAQTDDGYLWLGTGKGLIRFDGMRFTDWTPGEGPGLPSSNIGWLRPASGGGLWVATGAGLCRIYRGRVIRYPALDKLPCPVISSLLEERPGRRWLLNTCPGTYNLALLSADGSLRTFGPADGLPELPVRDMERDDGVTLTVSTAKAICRWAPGRKAECTTGASLDLSAVATAGDRQLVVADNTSGRILRFSDGQLIPGGSHIQDVAFTRALLVDRDGNAWAGTLGQGLLRVRGDRVDRYTRNEGLSNNLVNSIIEDHEGNIWMATARGIDRIRDPRVQLYSANNGLSGDLINTVYGGRDGAIWIGTAGGGLNRLAGETVTVYGRSAGLPNPAVISSFQDRSGNLWTATPDGLTVLRGERFSPVLTPAGERLHRVFNIAADPAGTVWLLDNKLGLFRVEAGIARPVSVADSITGDIVSLLADAHGKIWMGHQHGGITELCQGSTRQYGVKDGLGSGPVRTLLEDRHGNIWAGVGDGISRHRQSNWTTWTSAQGLPEGGVQGIVEDDDNGLWLLTEAGVLRLPVSSFDSPPKPLHFTLYGGAEGLRLGNSMTNPRLTRSRDGRIWVCTQDGVAAIDPTRIRNNEVAPPVVVEQVIADGRNYDPASGAEIAFRGHDLQIVYTGISLMAPERVRFRYRLENMESQWTDAGTRRNVAYMNLSPGHYRFHVIACNNDDLWNTAGAEFALRVDPYLYQTKGFALFCLLTLSFVVWWAHHLKMRRVVSRLQLIAGERVRFSRELHDSLLQGFSGVVFLLEAAARQFETAPVVAKQQLNRAVDQADHSLREVRELISSLRIQALENNTLPEALRTTIEPMVAGSGVEFQFELKGRVQKAPYHVEANLYLLVREAVRNALAHASARHIRLEVCYTPTDLRVTLQDDGTGFDPEAAMAKSGHWGFRGMHERARAIGARFHVDSAPGHGTTIEVAAGWKK